MKIKYAHHRFNTETLKIVETAESIIDEYQSSGYSLTLRQLYYQFVARDLLENTERSYKRLGSIITNARMAGMISWEAIEDRGRGVNEWLVNEDPESVFDGIEYAYALDFWRRQGVYVEVWIEKEALSDVLRRPCSSWRVPYMACKGYLSASEAWRAGQRYYDAFNNHGIERAVLIHLGDHDPSGIDMTRDNDSRLHLFSHYCQDVEIRRIALNMDQIDQYKPPPNPAKLTDTRAKEYVKNFGRTSWELDALEPRVMDKLISDEIQRYVDPDLWNETKEEENEERIKLAKIRQHWNEVSEFLENI